MQHSLRWSLLLAAILLGSLLPGAVLQPALASGSGVELVWRSIDSGGDVFAANGRLTLGSTTGQVDAFSASGGATQLDGGFWSAGVSTSASNTYRHFLPGVMQ